jgi:hypothetical protein
VLGGDVVGQWQLPQPHAPNCEMILVSKNPEVDDEEIELGAFFSF